MPQNRVPQVLALYWVIKIASTTLGETGADMVSMTYNLGYGATVLLFMGLFVGLLAWKLKVSRYQPILYWAVFTASAIAGTAISDYMDRTLGLGYATGSLILAVSLCLTLGLWYATERSLSVEKIMTFRSELFYWSAFLIANTLGTAAGDFLADDLGLGFAWSAGLISAVLVTLAVLHRYTAAPVALLFWLAFVLTRPFGATFGDLLTKTHEKGGLDLGTVGASLFFGVVLVLSVAREFQLYRRDRALDSA